MKGYMPIGFHVASQSFHEYFAETPKFACHPDMFPTEDGVGLITGRVGGLTAIFIFSSRVDAMEKMCREHKYDPPHVLVSKSGDKSRFWLYRFNSKIEASTDVGDIFVLDSFQCVFVNTTRMDANGVDQGFATNGELPHVRKLTPIPQFLLDLRKSA